MPAAWGAGTVTFTYIWYALGVTTNSVVWGGAAQCYTADTTILTSAHTANSALAEVTDAHINTASLVQSVTSPAITVKNAGAGRWTSVRVYRLGSGADNLAVTASLLGVIVTYT